jgi:NitT/TauT family transport system substrate-binding protein
MELGFFEEEGLTIDLVNGGGSDKSMTAVLSGDAHLGLMGPETAIYVYNQGKENHPVIIGQLTQCDGSFIVSKTPFENFTWEEMRGKTIIGGRKGGMPNMTLEYVLRNKGIMPGVDINVRTDIQFNLMAGAFEGSDAEFVALFEPTASLCEMQGVGYVVASVGAESGKIPYTAYIVDPKRMDKDRDLYEAYMRAVYKAQKWVQEHTPAEIAEAIAPQFPDADIVLLTKVAERYQSIDAWKTDPIMTEEDFNHLQDVIEGAGELTARADYSKVVDNSIAKKVAGK